MARIKINDLPKTMKINREDLRQITGGGVTVGVNNLSVVHKGSALSNAAVPDVCITPSPGGPIPVPYSDSGTKADVTTKVADSVKVSGQKYSLLDINSLKMQAVNNLNLVSDE